MLDGEKKRDNMKDRLAVDSYNRKFTFCLHSRADSYMCLGMTEYWLLTVMDSTHLQLQE